MSARSNSNSEEEPVQLRALAQVVLGLALFVLATNEIASMAQLPLWTKLILIVSVSAAIALEFYLTAPEYRGRRYHIASNVNGKLTARIGLRRLAPSETWKVVLGAVVAILMLWSVIITIIWINRAYQQGRSEGPLPLPPPPSPYPFDPDAWGGRLGPGRLDGQCSARFEPRTQLSARLET